MFKKIINYILKTIILLIISVLCTIYITRTFLSVDNISNIIFSDTEVITTNLENDEFIKYIDQNKLKETYSTLIINYFKYNSGIIKEKPSSKDLLNIFENAYTEYEKESNTTIDHSFIKDFIYEIDKELSDSLKITNPHINKILIFLFNNKYLITLIILLIITIISLLILNGIIKTIINLGIMLLCNSFLLTILTFSFKQLFINNSELTIIISQSLIKLFKNVIISNIIIGLILIIIYFIIKKVFSKKSSYQ